jgi:hypothetical protein
MTPCFQTFESPEELGRFNSVSSQRFLNVAARRIGIRKISLAASGAWGGAKAAFTPGGRHND